MINRINKTDIPAKILKTGWKIPIPRSEDAFFVFSNELETGFYDYVETRKKEMRFPKGIIGIEAIDDRKYFRISYIPEMISNIDLLGFADKFFNACIKSKSELT